MTGELAALSSAFLGTLSSTILKREAGTTSAIVLSASRGLVATVFYLALLPFFGGLESYRTVPPAILALLVVSTLIGQVIGDTLFFRSVMLFGLARTMPIVSAYPLVSTLLAVVILGEPLGWIRFIGVILVVIGLIVLTQQPGTQGSLHRGRRVGLLNVAPGGGPLWLLFLPPLLSGVNVFLIKPVTQYMNPVMINSIRQPIIALILSFLVIRLRLSIFPATGRPRFVTSLLIGNMLGAGISSFLFLTGIQIAGAARGGTLASTGPLFALLLAPLLLGEKITRMGVLGSILTVIGVWLLL